LTVVTEPLPVEQGRAVSDGPHPVLTEATREG
jgi:hypothetical protein